MLCHSPVGPKTGPQSLVNQKLWGGGRENERERERERDRQRERVAHTVGGSAPRVLARTCDNTGAHFSWVWYDRRLRTNISDWRTAATETSVREWLATRFSRTSVELDYETACDEEELPETAVRADPWAGMPRAGPMPGAAVQWRSTDPMNPHGAWIGSRSGPSRATSSEILP
jgi:hypothetical protein